MILSIFPLIVTPLPLDLSHIQVFTKNADVNWVANLRTLSYQCTLVELILHMAFLMSLTFYSLKSNVAQFLSKE